MLLDFITDAGANTPPNRVLESANRLIEFPFIYKHLICGGYLTPDENIAILSWFYDETAGHYNGAYILFNGPTATVNDPLVYTNWGLWHLTGFYSSLSYFPEFADAPAWKNVFHSRLGTVMDGLIMEDGSYNEVTFGYPGSVLSWCATLKNIMTQFEGNSANTSMLSQKMLRLTKYLVDCSLPTGRLPCWGEGEPANAMGLVNTTLSGLSPSELQQELAGYLRYYQNRNNGIPLETTAQYDGIKVVTDRTGWTAADSMIFMNAKCGGSHSHRDALALLLHYDGRNLLADTGMTSYDGAHPHFPFQRSTTRSHNTIEIDGLAQTLGDTVTGGADRGEIAITGTAAVSTIRAQSTANHKDMSTTKVEGHKTTNTYHSTNFTHSRDVSFLKELDSILIVTDKVVPEDSAVHSYTQNWHCAPYANSRLSKDAYLTGSTSYSSGPNLIIAQAGIEGITASLQTGYDATAPAAPTKYFEYKQSKAGTVTYQTLLYPVAMGATATVRPNKLPMENTTDAQALAMEVAISDSSKPQLSTLVHYHSFEDSPKQRSFNGYSTNAATAMAALDSDGMIFFASVSQGSSLTKDGTVVLQTSEAVQDLSAVLYNGVLSLYSQDPRTQSLDCTANFSAQQITKVLLNGEPIAFTQKADGSVLIESRYVLLDFCAGSMAAQTTHWSGLRSTAEVDRRKGILSGTVSGGDPYIRMTASAERLNYQITAGDVIELRMKTTVTEGNAAGIQVFFQNRNTAYSEPFSCKDATLDHATGRYTTIQLPFSSKGSYLGTTIDNVRVDLLNVAPDASVSARYEIDYIYIGPAELAPSARAKAAEYLYFDFANRTMDEQRYAQEAYGGNNFDTGNWAVNPSRANLPVLNNAEGILELTIPQGGSAPYFQTSMGSNSLTEMPLTYFPNASDVVQIRLKLRNCTGSSGKLCLFYIKDNSGTMTNDYSSVVLEPELLGTDSYFVKTFPVPSGFAAAEVINSIRISLAGISDDGSGNAKISIDYIYIGSKDGLPTPQYTVSFRDAQGTLLQKVTLYKGEAAHYTGAVPTQTPDERNHYSFTGWDKDLSNITGDTNVTAQFAAQAHRFSYTAVDQSTHTLQCSCGYRAEAAHSYTDGLCICGQKEVKEPVHDPQLKLSHTLELASDISVKFVIPKSLLEGFDMDTVFVLTEVETYEGNSKTGTVTYKLFPEEVQESYYYFTLNNLTAIQMNDRLRSVLYGTRDGQPYYSPTDDYSIADYAYSQINKPTMPNSLKTLCADLLRYGSSAQIFKAYRTDALADSAMTDVHRAYLSDMEAVSFGNTNLLLNDLPQPTISWTGKTLDLQSKVTIKYVFSTADYSGKLSDLCLHVSYTNQSGKLVTAVVTEPENYSPSTGHYAFSFSGLPAAELRSVVSAQIYEGDRAVSCTMQYSPDTYGVNKTGALGTLCKAIFAYSDSAKAYFS